MISTAWGQKGVLSALPDKIIRVLLFWRIFLFFSILHEDFLEKAFEEGCPMFNRVADTLVVLVAENTARASCTRESGM